MDEFERAAELEQWQRDIALANVRAANRSHLPSRADCKDCGYPVEPERQAMGGAERCSECQGYYLQEQRQKGLMP